MAYDTQPKLYALDLSDASPRNQGYVWRRAFPAHCETRGNPYMAGTPAAEAWLDGVCEAEACMERPKYVAHPQSALWPRGVA